MSNYGSYESLSKKGLSKTEQFSFCILINTNKQLIHIFLSLLLLSTFGTAISAEIISPQEQGLIETLKNQNETISSRKEAAEQLRYFNRIDSVRSVFESIITNKDELLTFRDLMISYAGGYRGNIKKVLINILLDKNEDEKLQHTASSALNNWARSSNSEEDIREVVDSWVTVLNDKDSYSVSFRKYSVLFHLRLTTSGRSQNSITRQKAIQAFLDRILDSDETLDLQQGAAGELFYFNLKPEESKNINAILFKILRNSSNSEALRSLAIGSLSIPNEPGTKDLVSSIVPLLDDTEILESLKVDAINKLGDLAAIDSLVRAIRNDQYSVGIRQTAIETFKQFEDMSDENLSDQEIKEIFGDAIDIALIEAVVQVMLEADEGTQYDGALTILSHARGFPAVFALKGMLILSNNQFANISLEEYKPSANDISLFLDSFFIPRMSSHIASIADNFNIEELRQGYEILRVEHLKLQDHLKKFGIQSKAVPAIKTFRISLDTLKDKLSIKESSWMLRLFKQIPTNVKILVGALIIGGIILPLLWIVILWLRPLWLPKIDDFLKSLGKVKLPSMLGGLEISLPIFLLIRPFSYSSKVLHTWVEFHRESADGRFGRLETVKTRRLHIGLPIHFDNSKEALFLSLPQLRAAMLRQREIILIWSEGGAGKTSIACRIARWGLSTSDDTRLFRHPILPILIEQDILKDGENNSTALIETIRSKLQDLVGVDDRISDSLLCHLLKKRFLLIIIDHFSEMDVANREAILAQYTKLPINLMIVTSRHQEELEGRIKTEIVPARIRGATLTFFFEAYVNARNAEIRSGTDQYQTEKEVSDFEMHSACAELSEIVGTAHITVFLARLFADLVIGRKHGATDFPMPDSIPALMLSYINILNREPAKNGFDHRTVQNDAKTVAWQCICQRLSPGDADIKHVLDALGGTDSEAHLKYLEERLQLIKTIPPRFEKVRFQLDPLAEYLAALHIVDKFGGKVKDWQNFFDELDRISDSRESSEGFLIALNNCAKTEQRDAEIADYVDSRIQEYLQP